MDLSYDGTSRTGYVVARGGNLLQNPTANVAIEVEPDAPDVVNLWVGNGARDGLFTNYASIKARVGGVQDPAGNPITATDADQNLVMTSL